MEALSPASLPAYFVRSLGDAAFRVGRSISDRQRIALSADGATLFVAEYPSILALDARDGLVHRWMRERPLLVTAMDLASDHTLCVLHSEGLSWVDPTSGAPCDPVALRAAYNATLAASPTDPRRAVIVGTASYWDIELVDGATTERVRCAPPSVEQQAQATAVAFSTDGATLFVAERAQVHRVDARTGAYLGVLAQLPSPSPHDRNVRAMLVLDERSLLVLGPRSTLWLIDAHTGALRAERSWGDSAWMSLLEGPDRDGRVVLARSGEAYVLDGATLEDRHVLRGDVRVDHAGRVLISRQTSDGYIVDTRGALHPIALASGALRVSRPACFPSLLAWRGDALLVFRMGSAVEQIDLASGASSFIEPAFDGVALAYDAQDDRALGRDSRGVYGVFSLADASFVAPDSAPRSGRAARVRGTLWSIADRGGALVGGDRTIDLSPCKDPQWMIASPSGERMLVGLRSEAILVDLIEGAVRARYKLMGVSVAEFIDEDEVVCTGSKGTRWIDARTGEVRARSKQLADRAAFSKDGRRVLLMQGVDSLVLIDRERPDDVVAWRGASHPQRALFSRDGARVFVAGAEAIVREYDVEAALATREDPKAAGKGKRSKR